ncbi:hypothetical protein [Thalassotalea sp. PLHSN55]|uniref:hypothetical protein n=1 Tax=Thalassotalea sp. PLHSN55 TaxID=3435888 RepID=UPI003F8569C1
MMNFKLKHWVVPTLLTMLAGCNSSDSDEAANQAPQLTMPELLETEYSTLQEVYDISTDQNVMQAQYTFNESDTFDNGAVHFDIDLLKGFTDADDGQLLSIKNFKYVWVGPDCSDTIVAAANYPEICEPILTPLGYEIGQADLLFEDRKIIRKAQNYPITDEILYGFEMKQTVLTVTPKEFVPILYQDEVSVVNISFDVTDGIDSVRHYVLAKIVGENVAPEFLELEADGSPVMVDGETQPLAPHEVDVSEKSEKVTVNVLEGIYDQDIYQNEAFAREVGDLDDYYVYHTDTSYNQENININFNITNITFDGVTQPVDADGNEVSFTNTMRVEDPITGRLIGFEISFDPTKFADQLARGEVGIVTYNFTVTDGNNADNVTERTATFRVQGANLQNEPAFEGPLEKEIFAHADITTFDLLEGVLDLDGDPMEIIDVVVPPEAEVFGIGVAADGSIVVDPYAFLYIEKGETEEFNFAYKITDGTLTSAERMFTLTIKGADVNLVIDGTFEDGVLGEHWKTSNGTNAEDPAGVVVNTDSAFTGNYGVETLVNDVGIRLHADGIKQDEITEDDSFYVSWQSKSRPVAEGGVGKWENIVVSIKNAFTNANVYTPVFSTMRGVYSQTLHTVDFLPDNFFEEDEPIEIKLSGKQSITFDDVRLVKYRSTEARNLVKGNDGHFNSGTAANWAMSDADSTIAVTEEANQDDSNTQTRYGLELTNGANWNSARLLPNGIKQGTFKSGIRYIVEFDFQNTGADTSNLEALELKLVDQTSGNFIASPKNRLSKSTTEWQDLRFHFVTDSETVYFGNNKPLASDTEFDWSLADDVRLDITMPPNTTFNIDNVRIYPVPE